MIKFRSPLKIAYSLVSISSIFITGCGESITKVRLDMNRLEQSINDMRDFQAEHTTQIAGIRNDIRTITGRLDEMQHSQSRALGSDLNSIRSDLSNLKRRVPPPPVVPVAILEKDEVFATTLPEEIGRLLTDSLVQIREGNFAAATPALKSALELSYGKDWSANILFWLGVSYDGLEDNRNALAAYNEQVSRFSRHERAPQALLRQAAVFSRLGDIQAAKLTLKKLIAEYPKSSEVAQAKEKLKGL